MPNKIEKLADGNFSVTLETGEIFSGDPLEVTTKLADARLETGKYAKGLKAELETLRNTPPPATPPPVTPPKNAEEAQLQKYLLEQYAQALDYKSADEFKADLARVKQITNEVQNQNIASTFMQNCPEFPNSPQAIESLSKKIDELGWDFRPQDMMAAHLLLTKEHAADPTKGYAPLTAQQVNDTWAREGSERERRAAAPPMLRGQSPDASQQGKNEWTTPLNELRAQAIRQELEGKTR